MSAQHNGGPAFPIGSGDMRDPTGMTLRDYFAAKAMQGLLANSGGPIQANHSQGWNYTNCTPEDVARTSYAMADAMLKAREEGGAV